MKKLKAFTLTEILITLGIIGVVAALSMIPLITKYQKFVYVNNLKKFYTEFSQAITTYQKDNECFYLTDCGMTSQAELENFIKKYFKIVLNCNGLTPCFANDYTTLKNGTINIVSRNSFVLSNGSSVRLYKYTPSVQDGILSSVMIDTNGKKGPNILGRDMFFIALYNSGRLDDGNGPVSLTAPLSQELRNSIFNSSCIASGNVNGWGCFGKILNDNWQMNY